MKGYGLTLNPTGLNLKGVPLTRQDADTLITDRLGAWTDEGVSRVSVTG